MPFLFFFPELHRKKVYSLPDVHFDSKDWKELVCRFQNLKEQGNELWHWWFLSVYLLLLPYSTYKWIPNTVKEVHTIKLVMISRTEHWMVFSWNIWWLVNWYAVCNKNWKWRNFCCFCSLIWCACINKIAKLDTE